MHGIWISSMIGILIGWYILPALERLIDRLRDRGGDDE